MPVYELTLEAEFSAAHRLRMGDGTYEPLHGHNWRVEAYFDADALDETGMAADFNTLRERLTTVLAGLHDCYLNEHPAFERINPSTEHVARFIYDQLAARTPPTVRVTKIRVWEAGGCAAAYRPGRSTGVHETAEDGR
jgi:6-pyruvoyltetrahydropterin/6-carboxytetrahydropterin synthase